MKRLSCVWAVLFIMAGLLLAQGMIPKNDSLLPAGDSLKNQSLQQAESLLVEHSQQKQLDSLVQAGLRREMQKMNLDVRKQKELEDKLGSIALADSLKKVQRLKVTVQPLMPKADPPI